MQDAHLNSGTPIFKIPILAQFVSHDFFLNNPLSCAKSFHFKSQTHIEHYSAEHSICMRLIVICQSVKNTPPSNANSCEF